MVKRDLFRKLQSFGKKRARFATEGVAASKPEVRAIRRELAALRTQQRISQRPQVPSSIISQSQFSPPVENIPVSDSIPPRDTRFSNTDTIGRQQSVFFTPQEPIFNVGTKTARAAQNQRFQRGQRKDLFFV